LGPVLAHPTPARPGADCVARDPHVHLDVEPLSPSAGARRGPDATNDGRCAGIFPGPLRERCPPVMRCYDFDFGTDPRHIHAVSTPNHHSANSRVSQGMKNGIRSNGIPSFITLPSSHDYGLKITTCFCKR
jgi:hypothetical protein